MIVFLIIQYIGICLVIANCGKTRQIGFTNALLISLLLSPLAGAIALFNSEKLDDLQHKVDIIEELKKLNQNDDVKI